MHCGSSHSFWPQKFTSSANAIVIQHQRYLNDSKIGLFGVHVLFFQLQFILYILSMIVDNKENMPVAWGIWNMVSKNPFIWFKDLYAKDWLGIELLKYFFLNKINFQNFLNSWNKIQWIEWLDESQSWTSFFF